MSLKNFFEELKKELKKPAYLLYAEDAYLLKEAAFSVKRTIPEAEQDFLFHMFDMEAAGDTAPVEQIIDVLYTVPLMGGRKTVVIENSQKLSDTQADAVASYISSPSPDSVLILLNSGRLKKSHKDRLSGARLISLDIREKDIPFWIKQKAAGKGLDITGGAVEYLIGIIGPDAGLLSSEIEKFTLCGKKRIDVDDVEAIVKGSGSYDVFDLVNALKTKNAKKVFSIYRVLSETQEPYSMLGALNWHYGRMSYPKKVRGKVFALLNEADTMIKTSGGAYPLEHLLVRLLRL